MRTPFLGRASRLPDCRQVGHQRSPGCYCLSNSSFSSSVRMGIVKPWRLPEVLRNGLAKCDSQCLLLRDERTCQELRLMSQFDPLRKSPLNIRLPVPFDNEEITSRARSQGHDFFGVFTVSCERRCFIREFDKHQRTIFAITLSLIYLLRADQHPPPWSPRFREIAVGAGTSFFAAKTNRCCSATSTEIVRTLLALLKKAQASLQP